MSAFTKRGAGRLSWLVAVISCAAVALAPAASAAQQQNAYVYVYWNWNGARVGQNVDQFVRIAHKAPTSYWALNWSFDGSTQGGYVGLQTGGNRSTDGSTGDTANFALWGADAASSGCAAFGGEGTGFRCGIPFRIRTDRYYRYRVWKLNNDGQGQWWGAWILDEKTGVETFIGSIRVATTSQYIVGAMNFSEYFGRTVSTPAKVPEGIAYFTQPAADSISDTTYRHGTSYASSTVGNGTTGSVAVVDVGSTLAALTRMGGGHASGSSG